MLAILKKLENIDRDIIKMKEAGDVREQKRIKRRQEELNSKIKRRLRQIMDINKKIVIVQDHIEEIEHIKKNLNNLDKQVVQITSGDFKVAKMKLPHMHFNIDVDL